ncbi:hypothetical protein M728_005319 (plasmid) [Ensifer sp. WSM1721]
MRELSSLYRAFVAGQDDPLPPLAIQYPDYAAWQRQWLSGERLQSQAQYWRETLSGAPARLALPTDRPRPLQQSFAGASVPVVIDAALTGGLKRLSRKHGTTLFMTVLAAWAAVLSRLSGQDDLVIGVPSANRSRREVEELIGFFVNTLALRLDWRARRACRSFWSGHGARRWPRRSIRTCRSSRWSRSSSRRGPSITRRCSR